MTLLVKVSKPERAVKICATLREAGVFSCVSGCVKEGYSVIVAAGALEKAKEILGKEAN